MQILRRYGPALNVQWNGCCMDINSCAVLKVRLRHLLERAGRGEADTFGDSRGISRLIQRPITEQTTIGTIY